MGMSSSQARLLSLTGRMHDIELKSQRIQAQKLRLANESGHVYEDYVNALEAKKLMTKMINSNGEVGDVLMTGGKSLTYGSYIEQYAMLDRNGKTLVSQRYHESYSSTNSLAGFLEKEGLWVNGSHYEQLQPAQEINPDYTQAEQAYVIDYNNWDLENYEYLGDHNKWLWEKQLWEVAYAQWEIDYANYQQYLSDYAAYENDHAAWEVRRDKRIRYEQELDEYNVKHPQWVVDNAAYQEYLRKKGIHDNWVSEMNKYNQRQAEIAAWEQEQIQWQTNYNNAYADWQTRHDAWAANHQSQVDAHDAWQQQEPVKNDHTQAWWSIDTSEHNLYAQFEECAGKCYTNARDNNNFSCYRHILSHIIDYSEGKGFTPSNNTYGGDYNSTWYNNTTYTTSTGSTYKISSSDQGGYSDSAGGPGARTTWSIISMCVDDEENYKPKIEAGETCDITASSSEGKKLMSRWNTDGTVKSLKAWAIDLMYLCKNKSSFSSWGITDNQVAATVVQFHNSLGYCISTTEVFNQTVYDEYWNAWKAEEPTVDPEPIFSFPPLRDRPADYPHPGAEPENPTPVPDPGAEPQPPEFVPLPGDEPQPPDEVPDPGPAPTLRAEPTPPRAEPQLETFIAGIPQYIYNPPVEVEHTTLNNKAYAQWLVNLWYKMQHEDNTATVYETTVHDSVSDSNIVLYTVDNQLKKATSASTSEKYGTFENEYYVVVPDELLNSDEWLANSIENADITLQVYSKLDEGFVNTSVAHSSYMNYVTDETAVKKAEAKYEADMRRINQKDAQYDRQLSECETERQAIKTEMDTLKTVIRNNVDMNFKLFS